jgi:putative transposase
MTAASRFPYAGYRFTAEIISHAVWLYLRFLIGLRMVEEVLAARWRIGVSCLCEDVAASP